MRRMRRVLVVAVVVLGVLASGCSSTSESERATQFLDQYAADWNAQDEEAVFGMVLPNGVFVAPDGTEFAGDELIEAWTPFIRSGVSVERTGDAVDNGDGSYSFNVVISTQRRILTITLDGDELVSMVETRQ